MNIELSVVVLLRWQPRQYWLDAFWSSKCQGNIWWLYDEFHYATATRDNLYCMPHATVLTPDWQSSNSRLYKFIRRFARKYFLCCPFSSDIASASKYLWRQIFTSSTLTKHRQVWLILLADETQGVLCYPLTIRAIPERLRDASCGGAIQIYYLYLYIGERKPIRFEHCVRPVFTAQSTS